MNEFQKIKLKSQKVNNDGIRKRDDEVGKRDWVVMKGCHYLPTGEGGGAARQVYLLGLLEFYP